MGVQVRLGHTLTYMLAGPFTWPNDIPARILGLSPRKRGS